MLDIALIKCAQSAAKLSKVLQLLVLPSLCSLRTDGRGLVWLKIELHE